jgi:hypothetical protein
MLYSMLLIGRPGCTLHIVQAESAAERHAWVAILQGVIAEMLSSGGTSTSPVFLTATATAVPPTDPFGPVCHAPLPHDVLFRFGSDGMCRFTMMSFAASA